LIKLGLYRTRSSAIAVTADRTACRSIRSAKQTTAWYAI